MSGVIYRACLLPLVNLMLSGWYLRLGLSILWVTRCEGSELSPVTTRPASTPTAISSLSSPHNNINSSASYIRPDHRPSGRVVHLPPWFDQFSFFGFMTRGQLQVASFNAPDSVIPYDLGLGWDRNHYRKLIRKNGFKEDRWGCGGQLHGAHVPGGVTWPGVSFRGWCLWKYSIWRRGGAPWGG